MDLKSINSVLSKYNLALVINHKTDYKDLNKITENSDNIFHFVLTYKNKETCRISISHNSTFIIRFINNPNIAKYCNTVSNLQKLLNLLVSTDFLDLLDLSETDLSCASEYNLFVNNADTIFLLSNF